MNEPIIRTSGDLDDALKQISFQNTVLDFQWQFEWLPISVDFPNPHKSDVRPGWLTWVSFERPDTDTGKVGRGRGRDEIIWCGTTLSGVIKTAWLLVELMVRHELMEGFRWNGHRIFNPHHSIIDLAEVQAMHDRRVSGG